MILTDFSRNTDGLDSLLGRAERNSAGCSLSGENEDIGWDGGD